MFNSRKNLILLYKKLNITRFIGFLIISISLVIFLNNRIGRTTIKNPSIVLHSPKTVKDNNTPQVIKNKSEPQIIKNTNKPQIINNNKITYIHDFETRESELLFDLEAKSQWFPEGVIGDNITGYPNYIVPNIVHYILIDNNEINFVHYLSFKSVFSVQNPDKIMFHCNCDKIVGKYWTKLKSEYKNFEDKVIVRREEKPQSVFGIPFSKKFHVFHASDVLRNKVLMKFGGIYLDRDVVIFKSLDQFRKFEMTIDFQAGEIGTQVQIAHKRARFLRLYLQTYKKYDGRKWYWNAGLFPTQRIYKKYPHLVHKMKHEFGLTASEIINYLYLEDRNDWKEKYFTIHLFMRGNSIENLLHWFFYNRSKKPSILRFDEENVKTLKITFARIARHILYNNTEI